MSEDLEKTLDELGPGFGDVVARLRNAKEVEPRSSFTVRARPYWRHAAGLLAASLFFCFVLVALLISDDEPSEPACADGISPSNGIYSLAFNATRGNAIEEIKRTQNADGSWANNYLTRQNAAALKKADATSVAYRKAARYLRAHGLTPLSDDEFEFLQEKGEQFAAFRL